MEGVSFGDQGGVVMTAWFVADRGGGGGVDPYIRSRARESEEPLHSASISNFKVQNLLYGRVAKPFYSSFSDATESMEVSDYLFRWSSDYFFLSLLLPMARYERVRHLWGVDLLRERVWKQVADRMTGAFNAWNRAVETLMGTGNMMRVGVREASYVVGISFYNR